MVKNVPQLHIPPNNYLFIMYGYSRVTSAPRVAVTREWRQHVGWRLLASDVSTSVGGYSRVTSARRLAVTCEWRHNVQCEVSLVTDTLTRRLLVDSVFPFIRILKPQFGSFVIVSHLNYVSGSWTHVSVHVRGGLRALLWFLMWRWTCFVDMLSHNVITSLFIYLYIY